MIDSTSSPAPSLAELALGKLTHILGPTRGSSVYQATMLASGLRKLQTPDELYLFADTLKKRQGIESAVGGLLSVAAVLRGASARANR